MNVNKPLGGKQKGVYILFPESEYKPIRDIALRKKMTVDQYCEMIIRNAFQGDGK